MSPPARPQGTQLTLDLFSQNVNLTIFRKSIQKIQVLVKSGKKDGYFSWRSMYVYDHISLNYFSRLETFQRNVVQKIKTHILCSVNFFFLNIVPFMRLSGKISHSPRDHRRCKHIVFWITKTTDTHSEYITFISLPQQQRLHERARVTLDVHFLSLINLLAPELFL